MILISRKTSWVLQKELSVKLMCLNMLLFRMGLFRVWAEFPNASKDIYFHWSWFV